MGTVSKQYRVRTRSAWTAVYNLAIPNAILNSVRNAPRGGPSFRIAALLLLALAGCATNVGATDWNTPEQQLARKIVAAAGNVAISISFDNRSSLGRRDAEIIENGLRNALESAGARIAKADQTTTSVKISLSENLNSYVWVAEVHRGDIEATVMMVSVPRTERAAGTQDSVPLSIRKSLLWAQDDPILDVAVLEEGSAPTRLAVLSPEKVSLYRLVGGRWQEEQSAAIAHTQPWPRDLRGHLIPAKDHWFDVYLPGIGCRSTAGLPVILNCQGTDDPWPLTSTAFMAGSSPVPSSGSSSEVPAIRAFFAPTRNFFTGALSSAIGKFTSVPNFYSAAPLAREKSLLWLFDATDGFVHLIDGASDQPARLPWGSDLTSVRTACGAGWQVLATSSDAAPGDSVRAYEIPDRDPVAVSAPVDFPGAISALWTEARGDTAVAVAKNPVTGNYEAYRLAVACNQ